MNFQTSVKTVFSKYIDFSGRASRSEYWWFTLFSVAVNIVTSLLDGMMGTTPAFNGLFTIAVLLPSLAVTVRRLHDTDRSAWWILLILVPIIGWLILLYFQIQKGTTGSNRFGDDQLA